MSDWAGGTPHTAKTPRARRTKGRGTDMMDRRFTADNVCRAAIDACGGFARFLLARRCEFM